MYNRLACKYKILSQHAFTFTFLRCTAERSGGSAVVEVHVRVRLSATSACFDKLTDGPVMGGRGGKSSVPSVAFKHGAMITGGLIRKRVLSMTSPRGTAHKKLK